MFGQQSNTSGGGGLFGSSTPQQQNSSGGGLFGSSTPQQSTGGGGLFGSSTPQQSGNTGGGLFGSSAPQQNNNTGGGLFGSSAPPQNNNTGGGLFGQQNTSGGFGSTNTGGGGLFGGGQQQQSGGGLFGSSQPQQTGGNMFGSTNTNSSGGLFGGTNSNNQQSGGLFSNTQQNTGGGGLFGSSNAQQNSGVGMFNGGQQQNLQQQQLVQQQAAPWWYRELLSIQAAYQPGQRSRFHTMLYEVVGVAPDLLVHSGAVALAHVDHIKSQRKKFVLQSNPWIDQRDWQRAEDSNPDPVNWMPCPIVGVNALYKRVEDQASHVRVQLDMLVRPPKHNNSGGNENNMNAANPAQPDQGKQLQTIKEVEEKNGSEESNGENSNSGLWLKLQIGEGFEEVIEQCRHEHIRLKHRLIKALGRLERLQCASLRGGRTKPEIEFDERLDRLQRSLADPRGCRAQITQIATQLELEDHEESKLSLSAADMAQSRSPFFKMQDQDQQAIFNFLELQRDGIESLMKIAKRDMRDLEIIQRKAMSELSN
mmetsp:Transcript_6354/g.14043  ORF Transcript_6354/g.14043 Transcript_6354/m.14043 type:complete len:535 (-) Transcript_6354:14-1618(-)